MKELDMIRLNDIPDEPSAELNARTLAAMRAAEEKKTQRKVPAWRKIAVCAAMFCATLVLMGAGVRVFEYLTYVPGMGIVTADQAEVYTLEHAVEAGDYRIEAASMIPVTEGEHEGMWEVTLLTDLGVPFRSENPAESMPKMTLTDMDGNTCELTFNGGSSELSYYKGYSEFRGRGDYTLTLYGEDYPMTMKNIETTEWANYSYPVSDGVTVMAFPMSVGSRYLVFDVILEPESEEMAYWAENCEYIKYTPHTVKITDIEGNEFYAPSVHGHGIPIPESEKEHGINAMLHFKMEYVLEMIEYPELPVAKIEIENLDIHFEELDNMPVYKTTIPQLGETVLAENLPDGGLFYDANGLRLQFDSAEGCVDEQNNAYSFQLNGSADWNFTENVSEMFAMAEYLPEKESVAGEEKYHNGAMVGGNGNFYYRCLILGNGDRKKKVMDAAFGDEINVRLSSMWLTIDTGWTIDFTAPAETAE